jgi:hypothetical protein
METAYLFKFKFLSVCDFRLNDHLLTFFPLYYFFHKYVPLVDIPQHHNIYLSIPGPFKMKILYPTGIRRTNYI